MVKCAGGASLKAAKQPINTSAAAGKCFPDVLEVPAEFETSPVANVKGIARAKMEGVRKGRPAAIDAARIRPLKTEGMGLRLQRAQDQAMIGVSSTKLGQQ
jgi:hypothetical protein